MDRVKELERILAVNGIPLPGEKAFFSLVRFYDLVTEKNKVMNLTAITDFREFSLKHFADSLSLLKLYDINNKAVIDVGTGAGFPGIPLAVCCPDSRFTLIDSLKKRIDFLSDAVSELGLSNVTLLHSRAEDAGRDQALRENFDLAVSRAVAGLSTLVEYTLPFVKPGGVFVAYKGPNAASEIAGSANALKTLSSRIDHFHSFDLCFNPDDTEEEKSQRTLLFVSKIDRISKQYPRSSAKISKNPL